MLEALKNLFAVADLQESGAVHARDAGACIASGSHIPTPGVNTAALALLAEQAARHHVRLLRHVLGRQPVAGDDLRAGRHALHQRARSSCSCSRWCGRYLERLSKEGELGRRKITQYTRYLTVVLGRGAVGGHRHLPGTADQRRRRAAAGLRPGLGLPPDVRADADHRHHVRDVAGRADHRARHRQRHVADHLRGHRGQLPARGQRPSTSCRPGRSASSA